MKGPWVQECRSLLEAEKVKETDPPLQRKESPAQGDSGRVKLIPDFSFQSYKRNFSVKPPSSRSFVTAPIEQTQTRLRLRSSPETTVKLASREGYVCLVGRTIEAPASTCMRAGGEVRTSWILKIKAVTWYWCLQKNGHLLLSVQIMHPVCLTEEEDALPRVILTGFYFLLWGNKSLAQDGVPNPVLKH